MGRASSTGLASRTPGPLEARVAFTTVTNRTGPHSVILAEHHNEIVDYVSGTRNELARLFADDDDQYAVIIKNSGAGSKALLVQNNAGSTLLDISETGVILGFADGTLASPSIRFASDPDNGMRHVSENYWSLVAGGMDVLRMATSPYGSRAAFGNTQEPLTSGPWDGTVLAVSHIQTGDNNGTIAIAPSLINDGIWGAGHSGDPAYRPDSATIQASIYQTSATARGGGRCIAAQAIRARAANDASTWSGIEIGVATSKAGHSFETIGQAPKTMGLWVACTTESQLINLGETAVEADCAIYISGDTTSGWRYPLFVRDKDGTTIHTLHKSGQMCLAATGNAAAPNLAFVGDENTGLYHIGADGLGFVAAGREHARCSSLSFGVSTGLDLNGVITPTALGATTHNWLPTDLFFASVIRASASTSAVLTGINALSHRVLMLHNIGANTITLNNNDAASSAANRFYTPGGVPYVLAVNESVMLWYDDATPCWRLLGSN